MSESNSSCVNKNEKRWDIMLKDLTERSNNEVKKSMSESIKNIKLSHGLMIISSIKLLGTYLNICYCSETQEYFVLDDNARVYRYSIQGRFILPPFDLTSSMVFTKMIWCAAIKVLACYIPDNDLIWIVTPEFKLIQTIKNEFIVENLFYLSDINELLVVGVTTLIRYSMSNLDEILDCDTTINFSDDYCGPLWVIHQSSLIHHDASYLRMAVSYSTALYIFPLNHDDDAEINNPVKFIAKKEYASSTIITALHFHHMSQWIISGDQQGNVLGWTLALESTMKCLGHKGPVKIIISHPSICGFITAAEDNILQVWSCNFRGKIESFAELGPIFSMAMDPSTSSIATLGTKLNFFHMQQLYTFHSSLTAPITIIFSTNPIYSAQIICSTSDNNIYMLSSVSGKQLNIGMLPQNVTPISIAYSGITENIYIALSDTGNILVNTIKTRPMKMGNIWKNDEKIITCIAVYDNHDEIYKFDRKLQDSQFIYNVRARIIIGTATGEIVAVNETTGKYERAVVAHDGQVKKLHVSTASHYIVSFGEDKCIKIWKMLPNIVSSFALMRCIFYMNPITNIASMKFIICVTINSTNLQSHQLSMYNFKEEIKLEHHPSKDHSEKILGIATSEPLLICATSAEDQTIRVWNQQNNLIKILEVNTQASKLIFSSLRGDIIFSVGRYLYRLTHKNYLSAKYIAEISTNNIPEEEEAVEESIIKYNIDRDENEIIILHSVSSVPLGSLDPTADIPCPEFILQQHVCMQLKLRDIDIEKIKNKLIQRMRIVKKKNLMNYVDWKKHVDELCGVIKKIEETDVIYDAYNMGKIFEEHKNNGKTFEKFIRPDKSDFFKYSGGFRPNSSIINTMMIKKIMPSFSTNKSKTKLKYIYPF